MVSVGLGFGLEGAISNRIPAWVLSARKVNPPVARPPRAGVTACRVVGVPLRLFGFGFEFGLRLGFGLGLGVRVGLGLGLGLVRIPLRLPNRVGIEQAAVRGGVAAWLG